MKNNTLVAVGAFIVILLAVLYFRKPCGCLVGCRCCASAASVKEKKEGFEGSGFSMLWIPIAIGILFVVLWLVAAAILYFQR